MITTNKATDIDYNDMIDTISKHHRFLNNHPGIEKTYYDLKQQINYPNLKTEITKFINEMQAFL